MNKKINKIFKFARENGYVIDGDGKRIDLPDINSKDADARALTEWTAIEALIMDIENDKHYS